MGGILYFVPNRHWSDPNNSDLMKKYANDNLLKKTLGQYEEFKRLQPKEASQLFVETMASLANILKSVCFYHTHSRVIIAPQCSQNEPIQLCNYEKDFAKLAMMWKDASRHGSDEFENLLKEFPSNFPQDAYFKLAIKIIENDNDTSTGDGVYFLTEGSSSLVKTTIQTLMKLESHIGLITGFFDIEITKMINEMEKRKASYMDYENMEPYSKSMNDTKIEARETTLTLLTLLCSQEFWGRTIRVGKDTQIILCLFNLSMLILFYHYDTIPFALAFASHIVFAKIYIGIFGCLCRVKKYLWTLDLLDKHLEGKRKLQSRQRRNRNRRRH